MSWLRLAAGCNEKSDDLIEQLPAGMLEMQQVGAVADGHQTLVGGAQGAQQPSRIGRRAGCLSQGSQGLTTAIGMPTISKRRFILVSVRFL